MLACESPILSSFRKKPERFAEAAKNWADFKREIVWKLNDLIKHPEYDDEPKAVNESEYDEERINI